MKISAKIPDITLKEVKQKCVEKNIKCSTYNNFIVFRSSQFTYIIFKKRLLKNCEKDTDIKQHVNITVRSTCKIVNAIELLKNILHLDTTVKIPFKIDNLTATTSLGKFVIVDKFLDATRNINEHISFNPEKFPAVFIKHKNRKVLLFRSGKINILGCRTNEEVNETYLCLKSICANI